MVHRSQICIWYLNSAWSFSDPTFAIKSSRSYFEGKIIFASRETKKQDCLYRHLHDTIRMRQEPCVYLRARLLVVPGACFAARSSYPIPGGNHFRPPPSRAPTALSPLRFRRIWIGPDNIAVGTTPASPPAWYTRPHFIYSIVSKFSDPFVRLNL